MNLLPIALTQALSSHQWRKFMLPDHPSWAKNVLLIIIWMFVAAVLIGPLYRYFRSRRRSASGRSGAW